MSDFSLHRLAAADADAYRDLRLESLRLFPESFGSSWEEEADQPLAFWEKRLNSHTRVVGVKTAKNLIGTVAVSPQMRVKLAHSADIGGMYVRPAFHRQGVGKMLMQFAMELLRSDEFPSRMFFATLTVTSTNEAARRLYESVGFSVCGKIEGALIVNGKFHDELLMRARIA